MLKLVLYSRIGCCLCQGLETKLRTIFLQNLLPDIQLIVKDIDGKDITDIERTRYSMEVPVLLLKSKKLEQSFELPRVSPRLNQHALLDWLNKNIKGKIKRIN
ncbi:MULTISPECIES: glutaredoxin family protein [Prochlorococcus]|uniref:glutaredoxin family protein n=1 Tax=Prochlorococcus TaxID=1218 RepID=UPI0005336E03|nr:MULTISPECIES: glutaredoxin family protein [Prochlorococcus]KGG12983.1 Thioredoxin family protein [Prochlorococcus sp. MIT 0601]